MLKLPAGPEPLHTQAAPGNKRNHAQISTAELQSLDEYDVVARSGRNRSKVALLILDMLSEYQFPGAGRVLRNIRRSSIAIHKLKQRAVASGVPVIYVNDTAGHWESSPEDFIRRCCAERARGRESCRLLAPAKSDYFMFKPKHSGFYDTPLQTLLERLRVRELILTGSTAHQCVLFTAMDAHVRELAVTVPRDCVGGSSAQETRHALFILKSAVGARTSPSRALEL